MSVVSRCLVLVALLLALPVRAQETPRYWIVVSETVEAPVPEAAQARRALRGTAIRDREIAPEAREALRALGVVPVVESRWLGAVSAALTEAQREAVAALPFVREIRPVGRYSQAAFETREPLAVPLAFPGGVNPGPSQTQLASVGADALITAGYTGEGVVVGFLDTLFDFNHPALSHIAADGRLVAVQDFTGGLSQSSYHGLATTSVTFGHADGTLVGPAFDATVLAGTTEYAPTETHTEEDNLVAGLEWLEAQGADVVNISLGYSVFDPGQGSYTYADMDGNTTIVTRAADLAVARGMVVVTSAGNEGNSSWQFITAPADADSVITVGATTTTGTRASFSSIGPTFDGRTKPDVAAQGTSIVFASPGSGYGFSGSGTSFSAPLVTGVVAQLLQARPDLTPIQVRDALRATGSQASNPNNQLGWGRVNGPAALALVTNGEPPPMPLSGWNLAPTPVRAGAPLVVELHAPTTLAFVNVLGQRVAEVTLGGGRQVITAPDLPTGLYVAVPADGSLQPQRLVIAR